ncbi:hypothetical protein [Mycolicibacterium houstonense]|uniref:hypothetical protein n=1 Tax=Mycolicibacterium houstonense TaxID=146021 RepID=UPI000830E979|nr:hypothetical protein [Mycolicibacterium houstonense]
MKHPRDWTVATLLDRRITLGELWRMFRAAVRRAWHWWWVSGTEYPFIPDPLRVLPPAVADRDQLDWAEAGAAIAENLHLTQRWILGASEDQYPLIGEGWEALIAKAEDPYRWTPPDAWDDVIIRGTN